MGKHGGQHHFTLQQQRGFLSSSIQKQQQATKRVRSNVLRRTQHTTAMLFVLYWLAISYVSQALTSLQQATHALHNRHS
jgi:preprotein translocase subunit SecG